MRCAVAARDQRRREHLRRVDDRQVDRHVEVGPGGHGVGIGELRRRAGADVLRIGGALAVAGEDRRDERLVDRSARMRAEVLGAGATYPGTSAQ